jgi:amino acid transporter
LTVGTVTSNSSLISLADTLARPLDVVIIGLAVTLVNALVMIRGVKLTLRLNNVMIWLALLGYLIAFGLLITATNAQFISDFAKFASYQGVINAAHSAGYSDTGSDYWYATLGLIPYIFGTTGYGYITAYFSGEMRAVKKNALYSQVGSVVITGVILIVLGTLALQVFGYDFLGSMNALASTGSSQYPFSVPPFFDLFVAMLTSNPIILWLLVITFFASFFVALPPTYMIGTRNMFAWSFDRVLPERFSRLETRYKSPIFAVLVIALIEIAGLVATEYGPPSYVALVSGAGLAEILSLVVVAIVGIIFPYVKKDVFKGSPADIRVAGIPVLSLTSAVSIILFLTIEYYYLTNPLYGANTAAVYLLTLFSVALPIVIFAVSYAYHKTHGLDILSAFKQIPPE